MAELVGLGDLLMALAVASSDVLALPDWVPVCVCSSVTVALCECDGDGDDESECVTVAALAVGSPLGEGVLEGDLVVDMVSSCVKLLV